MDANGTQQRSTRVLSFNPSLRQEGEAAEHNLFGGAEQNERASELEDRL